MKVAIVYFSSSNGEEKIKTLSSVLARGIQEKNRSLMVDLIDGRLEIGKKLTAYKYIIVGVPTQSWFKGTLPEQVEMFFDLSGTIIGKKSFAFTPKALFGNQKTLLRLMSVMESQGLFVQFSEAIENEEIAKVMGESLKIQ